MSIVNAKPHIFSTKMYCFYILSLKIAKILPFIYIVSKIAKGNTKNCMFLFFTEY